MNVYRVSFTTKAGTETYEYHNGRTESAAIRSLIAHKANNMMFAVDTSKPIVATFEHVLSPVEY